MAEEQQRTDFIALLTALFSSPNGDLEKKINSISYKNTTDVLNKHRYFQPEHII